MKYHAVLVIAFIIGCQTAKVESHVSDFKAVVAVKTVDDYTVLYAMKSTDTIAAIAKTKLLPDNAFDKNSNLYVDFNGLRQVDSVLTNKETVFFTYYIPAISCYVDKVRVIRHQPGPGCPRYVLTYSSLPYVIKSRKSFLLEGKY